MNTNPNFTNVNFKIFVDLIKKIANSSGASDSDNAGAMQKLFPLLIQGNSIFITNVDGFTVSPDGDYQVTDSPNYLILPDLTGQANRNLILPDTPKYLQPLALSNIDNSTFFWSLINGIVKDKDGSAITTLENQTDYYLIFGGTFWQNVLPIQ